VRIAVAKYARSLEPERRHDLFYSNAAAAGLEDSDMTLQQWVAYWADEYEGNGVYCDKLFVSVFGDMVGADTRVIWCTTAASPLLKGLDATSCGVNKAPSLNVGWVNGNHYVPLYGQLDAVGHFDKSSRKRPRPSGDGGGADEESLLMTWCLTLSQPLSNHHWCIILL
jgi:hypothetical protein